MGVADDAVDVTEAGPVERVERVGPISKHNGAIAGNPKHHALRDADILAENLRIAEVVIILRGVAEFELAGVVNAAALKNRLVGSFGSSVRRAIPVRIGPVPIFAFLNCVNSTRCRACSMAPAAGFGNGGRRAVYENLL